MVLAARHAAVGGGRRGAAQAGRAGGCCSARAIRSSGRSTTGDLVIGFRYVETPEPLVWDEPGTYVESDVQFVHTTTHDWNHGLGEMVTALLDEGLTITQLVEHDTVP